MDVVSSLVNQVAALIYVSWFGYPAILDEFLFL